MWTGLLCFAWFSNTIFARRSQFFSVGISQQHGSTSKTLDQTKMVLGTYEALARLLLAMHSNSAILHLGLHRDSYVNEHRNANWNAPMETRRLGVSMSQDLQLQTDSLPTKREDLPVVVITGASSGVGEAAVRRFAGTHRVIALARTVASLESLKLSCGANGTYVDTHVCDVSDRRAVEDVCGAILKNYGKVDVLINSAGLYKPGPIGELSYDDIDSMIDINLKGTIYVTKALVPAMIERKRGKIIMINSVAGTPTWTTPSETIYSASKHGQTGFANALANEVRKHGITVSSIHPGGIDTPMQRNLGTPEQVCDDFLTADEVVDAVEYIMNANPKILVKTVNLWASSFWH